MVIPSGHFSLKRAFTLLETMISMSIIVLFLGGAMTTILLAGKSYRTISDYTELMTQEREMMDWLSSELRSTSFVLEAGEKPTYLILYREHLDEKVNIETNSTEAPVSFWQTNNIPIIGTGNTNRHVFCLLHDPVRRIFSALYEPDSNFTPDPENPVSNVVEKILLENCDTFRFNLYQRNLTCGTNSSVVTVPLLTNTLSSCQFIEIFWNCRKFGDEKKEKISAELAGSSLFRLRK